MYGLLKMFIYYILFIYYLVDVFTKTINRLDNFFNIIKYILKYIK